jgi:hypothetical protein
MRALIHVNPFIKFLSVEESGFDCVSVEDPTLKRIDGLLAIVSK